MTDSATFLVDDADVPALRNAVSRLLRAGYCELRVRERLGLSDITDLLWRALPIYREEKLALRDALALTIDLFLLQGAISAAELGQLFDKADQDLLVRTGLVSIDDIGSARARLIVSRRGSPGLFGPRLAQASAPGGRRCPV